MLQKLDALRKQKGLTQGAIESAAALPANRISKWRDGKGEPTAVQALRIARLLGVTVESLIDDKLEATPDMEAARVRVVEIAQRIGWESVWLKLIGAQPLVEPYKAGEVIAKVTRPSKGDGKTA